MFSKNMFGNPGFSGKLNFTFGELSTWYMIIGKLKYLNIENTKFSVGIHIIT